MFPLNFNSTKHKTYSRMYEQGYANRTIHVDYLQIFANLFAFNEFLFIDI